MRAPRPRSARAAPPPLARRRAYREDGLQHAEMRLGHYARRLIPASLHLASTRLPHCPIAQPIPQRASPIAPPGWQQAARGGRRDSPALPEGSFARAEQHLPLLLQRLRPQHRLPEEQRPEHRETALRRRRRSDE